MKLENIYRHNIFMIKPYIFYKMNSFFASAFFIICVLHQGTTFTLCLPTTPKLLSSITAAVCIFLFLRH